MSNGCYTHGEPTYNKSKGIKTYLVLCLSVTSVGRRRMKTVNRHTNTVRMYDYGRRPQVSKNDKK